MEIVNLQITPVEIDFHGSRVTVNADAFTPEFYRRAARSLREQHKDAIREDKERSKLVRAAKGVEAVALQFEEEARGIEVEQGIYAALLTGTEDAPVILDWDWTRGGERVPVTEAELKKLRPQLLKDLYRACQEAGYPKSRETAATGAKPTISETSGSGSAESETIQAPEGRSM